MGFFSLLLVFLLMISESAAALFTSSGGGGAQEQKIQNTSINLPPASCPKVCGNVTFDYPFGVGERHCFRPGFELKCDNGNRSSPPALFLRDGGSRNFTVLEINMEDGIVYIKPPEVTIDVRHETSSASLIDLEGRPFSFRLGIQFGSYFQPLVDNSVYVVGCSAAANLVDSKTNRSISTCFTQCSGNSSSNYLYYSVLDLEADWKQKLSSLWIQLTRLDHEHFNGSRSAVAAIMLNDNSNDNLERDQEELRAWLRQGNTTLAWVIDDHATCESAKNNKTTYACLSEHSECLDAISDLDSNVSFGYVCRCDLNYRGNAYLPHGCQASGFTRIPRENCSSKCGDVNILYPFGLEDGCYRDPSFQLECLPSISNMTASGSDNLIFRNVYVVSQILLQKGQLELKITDHLPYYFTLSEYDESKFKPSTFLDQQIVYEWVVATETCDAAKKKATYACVHEGSQCYNVSITSNGQQILGYRCRCPEGYEGNPYVRHGCKDINECGDKSKRFVCYGTCTNTNGSYDCRCPPGSYGDPKIEKCFPLRKQPLFAGTVAGVSSGIGLLLLCACCIILRKKWEKRQQQMMRKRYFHQNHGLLLKQLISTGEEDIVERTKIFSLEEMEKATNNFDKTRVLGRGGHGTVYKGILSDQRVVAIKKSKITKQIEIDQFINEVVILSQISHRHVVKLFGCCLETEVPLLIYEFISNGTLSEHLHLPNSNCVLSWDDRLRIAAEAAEALAYLHSAASISIFHRDVKSSNILLDDQLSAKVSDFGTSRFIPEDQTHLVTVVQGTFGYLDPEYYHTSQLTEKSDVYSFGVILLELLTGKKPIYSSDEEGKLNLTVLFFEALRDDRIFDLMDDQVTKDGAEEEIWELIRLTERCLSPRGFERPTMKEVELSLQWLLRRTERTKRQQPRCIAEGAEESSSLLSDASLPFSGSVDQIRQLTSGSYSLEKELITLSNDNDFPR